MTEGTAAFFVFDYNEMPASYGQQAFSLIYEGLKSSQGTCTFSDGDVDPLEVNVIARNAKINTFPADNPKIKLGYDTKYGAYLVGIWTTFAPNIKIVHYDLSMAPKNGYLGYLKVREYCTYSEFSEFSDNTMHLSRSIVLIDGKVKKGTAKYGIGVNKNDSDLISASVIGDVRRAQKALEDGADIDCVDSIEGNPTPLLHAVVGGYEELVKCLLEQGANPNIDNTSNSPLMLAARYGHKSIVKNLLFAGADPALIVSGSTALEWAEMEGHDDIAETIQNALSENQTTADLPNKEATQKELKIIADRSKPKITTKTIAVLSILSGLVFLLTAMRQVAISDSIRTVLALMGGLPIVGGIGILFSKKYGWWLLMAVGTCAIVGYLYLKAFLPALLVSLGIIFLYKDNPKNWI